MCSVAHADWLFCENHYLALDFGTIKQITHTSSLHLAHINANMHVCETCIPKYLCLPQEYLQVASGFARTESGFVDETRNGETDDADTKDVTAQRPCDVGDNVDIILSDEHLNTAETFAQHVVYGTWLFYWVDGLCLVRG